MHGSRLLFIISIGKDTKKNKKSHVQRKNFDAHPSLFHEMVLRRVGIR